MNKEYKVTIGLEPKYAQGKNPNSRNGFKKGNKSGNRLGAKHTLEARKKIRESHKGLFAGNKNPAWKGGLSRLKKQEAIAGKKRPDDCEICGAISVLCFDHSHTTGLFRGWICHRCNLVLDLVKDNTELLIMLSDYLKK